MSANKNQLRCDNYQNNKAVPNRYRRSTYKALLPRLNSLDHEHHDGKVYNRTKYKKSNKHE